MLVIIFLLLDPGGGHPLRVLVESVDGAHDLLEGRVEVVVDDGEVEPVAVPELQPLAGLDHGTELVVLEQKRNILRIPVKRRGM